MDIFDWVKDIEGTYKYLIDKANEENQEEIESFENQQEKNMEKTLKKNKDITDSALRALSEEIHEGIKAFDKRIIDTLKKIEEEFNKKKSELISLLIERLDLEF